MFQSEKTDNLATTDANFNWMRMMLEASRGHRLVSGGNLTLSLEAGYRHDGGDAEIGGSVVRYTDPAGWLRILTDYLRDVRPLLERHFEVRFETPAGYQAQADFASFKVCFEDQPQRARRICLFTMVLGHSRWLWGRFCVNQNLHTVLRMHIRAFCVFRFK